MRNNSVASNPASFMRVGYVLLFGGLAAGVLAVPYSLRVALLPAAVVFGWSQIGGF
jgi:hypothetical protein